MPGCRTPTDGDEDVDPTGRYALYSIDGGLVPTTLAGPGGSATITGGWLILARDGTYREGGAAFLNVSGVAGWEVGRGSGTYTVSGSSVAFSDSGDGEGGFSGSWSAGRLAITVEGIESEFRSGTAIDGLDLSPADARMSTCAPVVLSAAAVDPDGTPVANPSVHWTSSDWSVATVDAGLVTPVGAGATTILATAGAGVDSAVVHVAFEAPAQVTVDPVVWDGTSPRLTWSPADPDAFCAYAISRAGNWGGVGRVIDSIFDPAVTTFLDAEVEPLFGLTLTYAVEVLNGPFRAISDSVQAVVGTSLAYDVSFPPLPNPTRDVIYLRTGPQGDTLLVLSTATHTVSNGRWIGSGPVTVRSDGETVLVVQHAYDNSTDSVYSLDPTTLAVREVVGSARGRRRTGPSAAGRVGRLYVAETDYARSVTWIEVLDTESGAELGRVDVSSTASVGETTLVAISPDLDRLYLAREDEVVSIDVSTDVPAVITATTMPFVISALVPDPDGAHLYVGQRWAASSVIAVLDAGTLGVDRQIPAPGLFDFSVTSDHLYVSLAVDGRPGDLHFLSGDVMQLDRTSFAEVDRYGFVIVPRWITPSRDGGTLYARGSSTILAVPVS